MTAGNRSWPAAERLRSFSEQLCLSGERRLLLIEGAETATQDYAAGLSAAFSDYRTLWVGPTRTAQGLNHPCIAANRATDWLGSELDLIIWNGWQGNPPGAFAALSGALVAGGLLLWLMPPLDDWRVFADPDYARTGLTDGDDHPFACHLARQLQTHPGVIRLSQADAPSRLVAPPPDSAFRVGDTRDQLAAIAAVVKTGEGRRRRPLVIRSDRGRGKSTALGRAAAWLLQTRREQIIVTAPGFASVVTLFKAAANAWPEARQEGQQLTNGEQRLRFLPPDMLLLEQPDAELILVDEAAGLPAPLLERILMGWPRVVFATTVHGYEGTGRGFDVRFRAVLDRLTPQWRSCQLQQPIRWIRGDPLEALIGKMFLLDAQSLVVTPDAAVAITPWRPASAPLSELKQAFGLLTDAHYRTTPGDLRQWLDDAAASSWVAWQGTPQNRVIVGVLWMTREGGLSPELAGSVMRGERRLRGHLLAQSLASHGGMADAAVLRSGRIVRIAVVSGMRRQGVGQRLVASARRVAAEQGLDLLGASFAAAAELVAFWASCGLNPLRLGLHQSASSGERTLQMGHGLSPAGTMLAQAICSRFAEHWPLLLRTSFSQLPVALVWHLMAHWPRAESLSHQDRLELDAFANGFRLFELSLLPLVRLSGQAGVVEQLSGCNDAMLWCRTVLQGWHWQTLQENRLCQGRQQGIARLRHLTRTLLND